MQSPRPTAPTAPMVSPATLDQITAGWLTAARYPGAAVRSVYFGTRIEGTRMNLRLLLEYDAAGHAARLPPTMWIKGALHDYGRNIRAAFEREALFYNEVAPLQIVTCPPSYFSAYVELISPRNIEHAAKRPRTARTR